MIAAIAAVLYGDWRLGQSPAVRDWAGGLPLAGLVLCIMPAAFWEVSRLARGADLGVLPVSGFLSTIGLGLWPYWGRLLWPQGGAAGLVAVAGLAMLPIFAEQMIRFRTAEAVRRIAATAMAVLYLGAGAAAILSIRMTWGVPALVLFLAAVKFTDMGAYFTGHAIGRHKLIVWLSPGKSWEGLAGGLAAAVLASVVLAWVLRLPCTAGGAAVFGVVMGVAGQFADLCESLLKRSAQVKDSGAVVPAFGGVLDILDSLLLAAPLAWVLMSVAVHAG
ncbi:MAG: phosphatidate cytidylyltransferase [Phycisphaerae bacterium]|jgi:phosphatidate cytidylyltransferase